MKPALSGAPPLPPLCLETTAMGAAYLAVLATGYWNSKDEVIKNQTADRIFTPNIPQETRDFKIKMWKRAAACSFGWAKED